MTQHVLLNNIEHKEIKIITQRSAELGDNLWFSPTFVAEFKTVQAHYPIMFQKDLHSGEITPVTLFGFKQHENLFLDEGQWQASYIPVSVRRLPFYIGFQDQVVDGVNEPQRLMTLDMASPRVSRDQGVELFLPFGGNSPYLETMADMLEALHQGIQQNQSLINNIIKFNLLESVTVDIELKDGSKYQMIGFYTINEDTLAALPAEHINELHSCGHLEALYMIIASQAHIAKLVELKNKRLDKPAAQH